MTRAWMFMPGLPAAGHVTSRGFWHPGKIDGCMKCNPPGLDEAVRRHPASRQQRLREGDPK